MNKMLLEIERLKKLNNLEAEDFVYLQDESVGAFNLGYQSPLVFVLGECEDFVEGLLGAFIPC